MVVKATVAAAKFTRLTPAGISQVRVHVVAMQQSLLVVVPEPAATLTGTTNPGWTDAGASARWKGWVYCVENANPNKENALLIAGGGSGAGDVSPGRTTLFVAWTVCGP